MSKLEVSLSTELHAEVKAYAESRGVKTSEVIADLVTTGLSRKRALSKYAKATAKAAKAAGKAAPKAKAATKAAPPKKAAKAAAPKAKAAAKPAAKATPAAKAAPAATETKAPSSVDRLKALKESANRNKPALKPVTSASADAVN